MISKRGTPALNDRGYYSWLEVSQRGQAGGEGVLTPQYKGDHKYTNSKNTLIQKIHKYKKPARSGASEYGILNSETTGTQNTSRWPKI